MSNQNLTIVMTAIIFNALAQLFLKADTLAINRKNGALNFWRLKKLDVPLHPHLILIKYHLTLSSNS
jgi:hypothetical protein